MKLFSAILFIALFLSCSNPKSEDNSSTATSTGEQAQPAPESEVNDNSAEANEKEASKTDNMQSATTVEITDANFDKMILKSDKVVLIDFWAPWCKPCLAIAPTMKELANEYAGKLVIGKLDIDKNPAITQKYGIEAIPMIMIFKKGKLVDKVMGAFPKEEYKKKIDLALK
jgi:thioredoxin 1